MGLRIDIADLEIDDANREKMHVNGVTVAIAFELIDGRPQVIPNRVGGGAPFLLVGPTSVGFVTLPIDRTTEPARWRPRTAYPAKPRDVARYQKMGSRAR